MRAASAWSAITQDTLADYVDALTQRGYTTSTIARKIAALKTLFHWLHQQGVIGEDPSLRLKSPRVEKRAPRVLSADEIGRLFEAAAAAAQPRSTRDRALLEVIYSTGMRVSEAINLRLADLSLETNEVRCVGRGNRQRMAPLLPRTVAALRDYLAQARTILAGNDATDYVFLNPQGAKLTRQAVWLMTRQYAKAAGIDGEVTPHTLRHSRAAHMLNSGEDVRRVQEWLGHANLATTQMYQQRGGDKTPAAEVSPAAPDEAAQAGLAIVEAPPASPSPSSSPSPSHPQFQPLTSSGSGSTIESNHADRHDG
jgi:integrase/recombinase XerD